MFTSKRKKYSPEFKREAIELVRRSRSSCRQVALEIGVAPNLLTRWVREAQPGTEKPFLGREAREMRNLLASNASWPE
ncbi:transposase [Pseudomonas sp. LTJR-52]|uniref:transposase n=1 Tax=Pseudomonas sp. LTJR-52 TaxID=2479392 RepID=UPI00355737F0